MSAGLVTDEVTMGRLYRIRRTVMQMLRDRGYLVVEHELATSRRDFLRKFGESFHREDLLINKYKKNDPSDQVSRLSSGSGSGSTRSNPRSPVTGKMDAGGGGILAAVLCMLLVFAIFPLLLWRRRSDAATAADNHRLPPQPLQEDQVLHGRAAARRMRRRPGAAGAASSSAAASTSRDVPEDDEEVDEEEVQDASRSSKKKEKKRQEREAQRQAEEAARDSRRNKQDRYEEMRRKKDEEREAQERQLEEEARARKAKEEEAAALEFEKWKGAFSVDAEGTTESDTQDDGQGLLHNFVEYIKKQKCVPLEDLAAEFRMRTQDCINRIVTLESMDRLSGVMDDRGKFIYISTEEMKAVAEYIRKQGRVSISHLANNSNQFIDLEPKTQYEESHQDDSAAAGMEA